VHAETASDSVRATDHAHRDDVHWDDAAREHAPREHAPRDHANRDDAAQGHAHREWQLERLIQRLPKRFQSAVRWLRQPSARWVRVPAGLLLIVGSVFSILPVLGLWMLPLGVVLLAEDFAPLRRLTDRALTWIERRRPHWMGLPRSAPASNHPSEGETR
jgi:hypothetical protein